MDHKELVNKVCGNKQIGKYGANASNNLKTLLSFASVIAEVGRSDLHHNEDDVWASLLKNKAELDKVFLNSLKPSEFKNFDGSITERKIVEMPDVAKAEQVLGTIYKNVLTLTDDQYSKGLEAVSQRMSPKSIEDMGFTDISRRYDMANNIWFAGTVTGMDANPNKAPKLEITSHNVLEKVPLKNLTKRAQVGIPDLLPEIKVTK